MTWIFSGLKDWTLQPKTGISFCSITKATQISSVSNGPPSVMKKNVIRRPLSEWNLKMMNFWMYNTKDRKSIEGGLFTVKWPLSWLNNDDSKSNNNQCSRCSSHLLPHMLHKQYSALLNTDHRFFGLPIHHDNQAWALVSVPSPLHCINIYISLLTLILYC